MRKHPPGYRAAWTAIGAAALALVVFQALRGSEHQALNAGAPPVRPTVKASTAPATPVAVPPTPGRSGIVAVAEPGHASPPTTSPTASSSSTTASPGPSPTASASASPAPSSTASTPTPSPTPTPSAPSPVLAASAIVALPVRSSTIVVRLVVTVPTAPPFPLLPGVEASIGLPGAAL